MSTEIAFELIRNAEWREQKAEKHPEDVRNETAAKASRELASQVISADVVKAYDAAVAEYEAAFEDVDSIAGIESYLTQDVMVDGLNSDDMRRIGLGWIPANIDEVTISLTENYKTASARVIAAVEKAKQAALD